MNVNTPAAAPMAFFVPSHNAVYDRATQLEGQWVTQREAITLESLRRLYPAHPPSPGADWRRDRPFLSRCAAEFRALKKQGCPCFLNAG